MTLSVVIPTYKRRHLLDNLLSALVDQTLPPDQWEVVVVDDQSNEDFSRLLEEYGEKINISLVVSEIKGRPGARNSGVQKAIGETVVFLDDDLTLKKDFLSHHKKARERTPGALIIGKIRSGDNDQHLWTVVTNKRLDLHEKHLADSPEDLPFYGVLTGNLSVPRQAFLDIGGFDALTFQSFACEDLDFGKRWKERGGKISYEPLAEVIHYEGKISAMEFIKGLKFTRSGIIRLLNKHKELIQTCEPFKRFPVKLGKVYTPLQPFSRFLVKQVILIPPFLEIAAIAAEMLWKIKKSEILLKVAEKTAYFLGIRFYQKAVKIHWKD